jgi:hypothetical protein
LQSPLPLFPLNIAQRVPSALHVRSTAMEKRFTLLDYKMLTHPHFLEQL